MGSGPALGLQPILTRVVSLLNHCHLHVLGGTWGSGGSGEGQRTRSQVTELTFSGLQNAAYKGIHKKAMFLKKEHVC